MEMSEGSDQFTSVCDPASDVYGPFGRFSRSTFQTNVKLHKTGKLWCTERGDDSAAADVHFSGLIHSETGVPHGYGSCAHVAPCSLASVEKLLQQLLPTDQLVNRAVAAFSRAPGFRAFISSTVTCAQWVNGVANGKGIERTTTYLESGTFHCHDGDDKLNGKQVLEKAAIALSTFLHEGTWIGGQRRGIFVVTHITTGQVLEERYDEVGQRTYRMEIVAEIPQVAMATIERVTDFVLTHSPVIAPTPSPTLLSRQKNVHRSPAHSKGSAPLRSTPRVCPVPNSKSPLSAASPTPRTKGLAVANASPCPFRPSDDVAALAKLALEAGNRSTKHHDPFASTPLCTEVEFPQKSTDTTDDEERTCQLNAIPEEYGPAVHASPLCRQDAVVERPKIKAMYFRLGQQVVFLNGREEITGAVGYCGPRKHTRVGPKGVLSPPNSEEVLVGIVVDQPYYGRHNGTVGGFQYFTTTSKRGLLVPANRVIPVLSRRPFAK